MSAAGAPVRWALAGYGKGGRTYHAPFIRAQNGLELAAVVTSSDERRAQLAADVPDAVAVASIAELPALGVRGVTVTTPSATHVAVAREAIDAGLAVVVDKPFALDADAAADLVAYAERAGVPLSVYQNRRWNSEFLTLRRLVEGGRLGEVFRVTARIERSRPVPANWAGGSAAEGGGVLLDLGSHLVDQALVLFGPAVSVTAQLDVRRPGAGAEDDVQLDLVHASGARSTLVASLVARVGGPGFEAIGSAGGYLSTGLDPQEDRLKAGAHPWSASERDWGVPDGGVAGVLVTDAGAEQVPSEAGAWQAFYAGVAGALRASGPLPVDPRDAVATARVLDAARVSAAESRTVAL